MNATIITIGDEILIGQVVDTNSSYMAGELDKIGIKVLQSVSIADTHEVIINALKAALIDSNIVLMTGGLGPTKDDITKMALADFFNCGMVRHQATLEKLENRLTAVGVKLSEINRAQADVPEKCSILKNKSGSAPGMLFKQDDKIIISMPGVPYEMRDIMSLEVIPYIKANYELPARINKTFLTVGVAESTLSDRLEEFEASLPANYSLAYLPSLSRVRLRLNAVSENLDELSKEFEIQSLKLESELGDDLFGYNNESLELKVGELLRANNFTLATAESCTGGNLAASISSIPGASNYYKGSIVAYANETKVAILGVSEKLLEQHGAVSREVVEEMAINTKLKLNTDFGIATSGIAGPDGGTKEKPVGTVWIALASPRQTISIKLGMGNNRERTVIRSTVAALNMLRMEIKSIVKKTVNKV